MAPTDGPERRAAVLGHPIGHSRSPALHRAAYRALGERIGYKAVDLTEQTLPAFMARVRQEAGWCGLSVTMPLKTAMIPELDELTGWAARLKVVNTVTFAQDGGARRLTGHNTDVAGIVNALRHAGVRPQPRAGILGGGGTAVAAVAALSELGAPAADIFVRDPSRAAAAVDAAAAVGLAVRLLPFEDAAEALPALDVVVSTLPPRGADSLAEELAAVLAAKGSTALDGARLLDVAYDPWPSRLAQAWQQSGGGIVPGLEMLIYQAVEQVKLFTARPELAAADIIDPMCDAVGAPRRGR
ncbi:shikimate dehydrogenase [Paenarthrobacter sp. DKR-5]|uniref:shikimate dehydrogenase n=1 Tax=Paenarthrobacter sp. DKR-5 TaxID=2835535 RepID=UPI001BDC5D5F|nr:shikimate dehydrogenase [Paenarthrobacter sp. DKR-5]MBT1003724.1 shikimate dehydrogenase [Paenarthrobacter sp. DKR-5]